MDLTEFQKKTGYFFKNPKLLQTAFTHTSYSNENKTESYERLEFLGDGLVNMIVAEYLYMNSSGLSEGEMSRLRSSLVCEKALSELATEIEIEKYMLLGNGAELSGDRKKPSILADMFEAHVAALYFDAGFENVRDYVISLYGDRIDNAIKNGGFIDYKTQLQEKLQKNGSCEIVYEQISAEGPVHHCLFEIQVVANGKVLGKGAAYSKKEAQQMAARTALEKLK